MLISQSQVRKNGRPIISLLLAKLYLAVTTARIQKKTPKLKKILLPEANSAFLENIHLKIWNSYPLSEKESSVICMTMMIKWNPVLFRESFFYLKNKRTKIAETYPSRSKNIKTLHLMDQKNIIKSPTIRSISSLIQTQMYNSRQKSLSLDLKLTFKHLRLPIYFYKLIS